MSHIQKFRKTFKIERGADLRDVAVAIDAIHTASHIGFDYLGNYEPGDDSTGFRVRSLHNLLARVFEHAQAMLVALSTGSAASSEALARIVVEGPINIMYLAALGDSATILEFFRLWMREHDRRLTEWSAEVEGQEYAGRVRAMIEERRKVIVGIESFVEQIETQCAIRTTSTTAQWPKSIFKRFEALGRQTDYYESCHRLSSASHISGEDTVMWLHALQMPDELLHRIGVEAWAYSIMMSRIASTFFVDAVAFCVIAHGRPSNEDIANCKHSLWKSIEEIAKAAGVPDVASSNSQ